MITSAKPNGDLFLPHWALWNNEMTKSNSPSPKASSKVKAARLSILSNTSLTIIKLVAGIMTGSVSVLSEAAHSATDLMASWIAFFSVRVSEQPADEKHPYGHGKVESLSGMAEALLIFGAAGYIIYESIHRILHQAPPPKVDLGIAIMAFSMFTNILVSGYLFNTAKQTDSMALEADAQHLRADIFTSLGVVIGLVLVRVTHIRWMDPAAAIVVALMIFHAAAQLTLNALAPLMDANLPDEEIDVIKRNLLSDNRVLAFHKLRTRKSGSARIIDAHILVDDNLSLVEAHALTELLEDRIREGLSNCEITLHTEPYREEQRHQYLFHGGPLPKEMDRAKDENASSNKKGVREFHDNDRHMDS